MADSDAGPEPTETTGLLAHAAETRADPALGDANGAVVHSSGSALENGVVEPPSSAPLLEGNVEFKRKLYLVFPAVSLGILLSAIDQTVIVASYGKIGSDLNALNSISWVATAYFITLSSCQPLYGKLSDIFGRKTALLFAYSVFGLGCLFCGLARNLGEMIAARALAGIGGGGMTTVVSILLSDIVPLRERGTWQGYANLIYAAGSTGGAPLGGILSDTIGWRWSFLGQAPLCLIAFGIVYFMLELPEIDQSHWKEKLGNVDFLGAFSLIVAVATSLIGLDRASNESWDDTTAIVCCSLAIPLFAVFIFIEAKIATFPFAPGHIIFERSVFASYLINFFAMSCYFSAVYYVPLYLQIVENLSAKAAGISMVPVTIVSVCGSLFAGRVIQQTGKYYWLIVTSLFISMLFVAFLVLSGGVFHFSWGLIIALSITSFGNASSITATLISVIANVESKDIAVATACTYLFRSLGCTAGASLASTVVQQILKNQLRARLDLGKNADKIAERVRQSLEYIKELEPHTREIVIRCYINATTGAFALAFMFIFLAFFCSFWIREKNLGK